MKKFRKKKKSATPFAMLAASVAAVWNSAVVGANPQGATVARGTVTITPSAGRIDVSASHNSVITWQSFNISSGETTAFHQPDRNSVVWNQINDANPSQIMGNITANGYVVLMNQNGFYFGPNSQITVGGFAAITSAVLPPPDSAGGIWSFNGPPPQAQIINHGTINVEKGGSLFLISEKVENHGTLSAPEGEIGLFAGKKALLSERPDGRGLSAMIEMPAGSVDNAGRIIAPGGEIALHAQVVNQSGLIQANSIQNRNGVIELVASDSIHLAAGSQIQAMGSSDAPSNGGVVSLKSAGSLTSEPNASIDVSGGALGGSGGSIELSAPQLGALPDRLTAKAQDGWTSGKLFLDPYDIELSTQDSSDSSDDIFKVNVSKAFSGFSSIHLQADHDIRLMANTTWNLAQTTGNGTGELTLEAGNDITFKDNSHLVGGGWNIYLAAGMDFTPDGSTLHSGRGGIYLNGNTTIPGAGSIETTDGNIDLQAGHEILVGKGYIRTTRASQALGGGNISIVTGDGDVDSGVKNDTYDFTNRGMAISANGLGGIGTAKGGNVSVNSGHDINSFRAYIGAFGAEAGNVTLKAKHDVKGFFMVRNGAGKIDADNNVGNRSPAVTLGLVDGGWDVHGGNDVFINEVYNPNGSLNSNRLLGNNTVKFQFDASYLKTAYAFFSGGHSVQFIGDGVLHTASNPTRPAIYPGIMEVTAGSGGVILANDLIMAPNANGYLKIKTTDGGSLQSAPGPIVTLPDGSPVLGIDGQPIRGPLPKYAQWVMSDSDSLDYNTFATGHAVQPIHKNHTEKKPTELAISGDLENIFIRMPMQASISAEGNAINFAYEGQNLSTDDKTSIAIKGDILNRSDRTTVKVSDNPDVLLLSDPLTATNPELGARLSYDSTAHELTVQGILNGEELKFLKNPTQYEIDPSTGAQKLDALGNPQIIPAVFTADTAALELLAARTQDIPTSGLASQGIQIGGPGHLEVDAHNMDLGESAGIRSVGPLKNPNLARLSGGGAGIGIKLTGDLEITSSQIASFNGGDISVKADGKMNVGSQSSFTSDDTPKGIYTAKGGSVTLDSVGDISINGSRVATYDGGNIDVTSRNGTVDAGSGAKGFFFVTTSHLNADGTVENRNDAFFGSGIMALTRSDGDSKVGNIKVDAGKNIEANSGGVIQIAFNQRNQSDATVDLSAGKDIVANQSGVLGRNVSLDAGGNIQGLIVASGNINIQAQQNVTVTALAGGTASVSGGGSVTGTIAGGGNVNVSGSEVSASVISTGGNANTSGESSGSTVGAFTSVAATGVSKTTESADKTVAAQAATALSDDEDEKKKRVANGAPTLQRRIGRVTVILPNK